MFAALAGALFCSLPSAAYAAPAPPVLVPHGGSFVGVSPAPAFSLTSVPGTTVQYFIQIAEDSGFTSIVYEFSQVAAQSFAAGAFTGQDGTKSVAKDAYFGASTATFAFYTGSAYTPPLSPNTQYWIQAAVTDDSGSTYSSYSTAQSFTTGEFASQSPINSAQISSVVLSSPTAAGTMNVTFHIRENNVVSSQTPNGAYYNTADWIIVKFSTQSGADWSWEHAKLASGGSLTGSGATLTLATDKAGAFLNHSETAALWSSTVTLIWDYKASGALVKDAAVVKVYTIPMVKVPQGSFVYNAGGLVNSDYNNYGGMNQITVGSAGDVPDNAAVGWPNGFNSFYIMRYPITQGLYADFLNNIPDAQAEIQDYDSFIYGYNITETPTNPYGSRYAAVNPGRVANFLSNWDLWRFLGWAALRPLTEMEQQKASRDIAPDARIYPWGSEEPLSGLPNGTTYFYTPPNEGGTHPMYYMSFGNFSGGQKVLDAGRYASGDVYRTAAQTGAAAYGVVDLAGQVWNQVLNCSFLSIPTTGNGSYLFENYANWPTTVAEPPGSDYISVVGGTWFHAYYFGKISLRPTKPSWSLYNKYGEVGGRGGRSP